jgi:hypothetical protein
MSRPEPIHNPQGDHDRDEFSEFMEGFGIGISGQDDPSPEDPARSARARGVEAGRDARKRAEEQAMIDFILTGEALMVSSAPSMGDGRAFQAGKLADRKSAANGDVSKNKTRNGQSGTVQPFPDPSPDD